jgi:hypothetical protein
MNEKLWRVKTCLWRLNAGLETGKRKVRCTREMVTEPEPLWWTTGTSPRNVVMLRLSDKAPQCPEMLFDHARSRIFIRHCWLLWSDYRQRCLYTGR